MKISNVYRKKTSQKGKNIVIDLTKVCILQFIGYLTKCVKVQLNKNNIYIRFTVTLSQLKTQAAVFFESPFSTYQKMWLQLSNISKNFASLFSYFQAKPQPKSSAIYCTTFKVGYGQITWNTSWVRYWGCLYWLLLAGN